MNKYELYYDEKLYFSMYADNIRQFQYNIPRTVIFEDVNKLRIEIELKDSETIEPGIEELTTTVITSVNIPITYKKGG